VSDDAVTIQQFSLALRELSISPDVCQEAAGAVRLLNRRKFDAVIVDLQLGEQCGLISEGASFLSRTEQRLCLPSVGSDVDATAAFRRKTGFVFGKPLSSKSIRSTFLRTDPERTTALLPVSHLDPRQDPETKDAESSLLQRKRQRRGHGREYVGVAQRRRKLAGSVYLAESQSCVLGRS
jgi:hypothetical protein